MAVPISFPSTTPNFSLPLLFAGQAQKEFFVNQSLSMIDALLLRGVVNSLPTPPQSAADGDIFRVTSPATDAWAGRDDQLAILLGGSWQFFEPRQGMSVFDRTVGSFIYYDTQWETAAEPAAPEGGANVDVEAREMLGGLVAALRKAGIFANPT